MHAPSDRITASLVAGHQRRQAVRQERQAVAREIYLRGLSVGFVAAAIVFAAAIVWGVR